MSEQEPRVEQWLSGRPGQQQEQAREAAEEEQEQKQEQEQEPEQEQDRTRWLLAERAEVVAAGARRDRRAPVCLARTLSRPGQREDLLLVAMRRPWCAGWDCAAH